MADRVPALDPAFEAAVRDGLYRLIDMAPDWPGQWAVAAELGGEVLSATFAGPGARDRAVSYQEQQNAGLVAVLASLGPLWELARSGGAPAGAASPPPAGGKAGWAEDLFAPLNGGGR